MKRNNGVGILVLWSVLACAGWAHADTVRLAWDANTVDHDLAAVQVYRAVGTCAVPGPFLQVATWPPLAVTGQVLVTTVGPSCFRITYIDFSGNESVPSNAVDATVTCPYRHLRCLCLAKGGHWNGTLHVCQ
jgi:hypothetical protein